MGTVAEEIEIVRPNSGFGFNAAKLSTQAGESVLATPLGITCKLDYYLAIFVLKGAGKVAIDFSSYDLSQSVFAFVNRGQLINLTKTKGFDALIFEVSKDFMAELMDGRGILPFSRLFSYHQFSPLILFSQQQYKPILDEALVVLQDTQDSDSYGYREVLQLRLKLLMYLIIRKRERRLQDMQPPRSVKLFSRFSRLVAANFINVKSAHDYARMLKISYKTLNNISKSNINKTAKAYIDYYTVLEIKRSLAYSTDNIQEIAYRFGFDEPTNMVKFFKKHTQLTPSQFRKQQL